MNKRAIGTEQEQKAAIFLEENGYHILDRNFSCRTGEIDLIARDGAYLCFVEVKFRSGTGQGYPAEAITPAKIRKITRTAQYYMLLHRISQDTPCRFDAVVILEDDISLIKDAFEC